MSYNRGKVPKILWGTGHANVLYFSVPLDNVNAFSLPRPGSEVVRTWAGEEDAWVVGDDYFLEGEARWIPGGTSYNPTGWDGAAGWDAFLRWARRKNKVRYYPDASEALYYECYLADDGQIRPDLEDNADRRLRLRLVHTQPFEGY